MRGIFPGVEKHIELLKPVNASFIQNNYAKEGTL